MGSSDEYGIYREKVRAWLPRRIPLFTGALIERACRRGFESKRDPKEIAEYLMDVFDQNAE